MIFEKPSLRTRFSFTIAMRELGGEVIESNLQITKFEEPEDTARVLSGYCDGIMLRTHDDKNLQRMVEFSSIPVINGLSANHHPSQIYADLMTFKERFGYLEGLKLSYIGDANNILNSLLLIGTKVGVEIHYCCPKNRQPSLDILNRAQSKLVFAHSSPEQAVQNTNSVYTDVWASMGFESDVNEHEFEGFQVDESLFEKADPHAIFMHCMPMCRGKEISTTLPEHPRSAVFQQSENRLHIQKSILLYLLKGNACEN
jgi:ornithine carbamoyltransferase